MADPLITLTTDFGEASPYPAAMKGVILSRAPQARIHDLSHRIPPQDVLHAAYFLADSVPYFPPGTLHVAVVDPGVGTSRRLLFADWKLQHLLLPDNGLITMLAAMQAVTDVRTLTASEYWRVSVSATFHGRDILASIAGHWACGVAPERFGPAIVDWTRLAIPAPRQAGDDWLGEIVFVDAFGNLISNLSAREIDNAAGTVARLRDHPARVVRTYGEGRLGELVALLSSGGRWEFAIVNGNAARHFAASVGTPVRLGVISRA